MWRLGCILLAVALTAGCGGRGPADSNGTSESSSLGTTSPTLSGNAGSFGTPVSVATGQSVSGVDVIVTHPALNSASNAEDLGVNAVAGQGMASNTGGTIHRGTTMRVLLFGPGLNGSMNVSIGGPPDISVSKVESVEATDNTPGIAFVASVSPHASLGARTVLLRSANGNATSFTGGLEVLP